MSEKVIKISQLNEVSSSVEGAYIPIVQGGFTHKITVGNFLNSGTSGTSGTSG